MALTFQSFAFINQGQQKCKSMVCKTPFNKWTATFFSEKCHKQSSGIVNKTGFMCLTSMLMLILKKKKKSFYLILAAYVIWFSLDHLADICMLLTKQTEFMLLESSQWVIKIIKMSQWNESPSERELHLQPAPVPVLCNWVFADGLKTSGCHIEVFLNSSYCNLSCSI